MNTVLVAGWCRRRGHRDDGQQGGDSTVGVDVGTLVGDGGSVTITFDVVVDSPFPTPTVVENQGEVTGWFGRGVVDR